MSGKGHGAYTKPQQSKKEERRKQKAKRRERDQIKFIDLSSKLNKAQEKKLNTIDMRMLRWVCGQTLLNLVEDREIRGRAKVTELHRKIQEKRGRWYGHILRRDEDHIIRRATNMKVEGRRQQGRPRRK